MNKKVLISLLLISVLAFGAGLATMAWFTSSSTSAGNVFEVGTLEIEGPEDGEIAAGVLPVSGIYPSWSDSTVVEVINSGSLPLKYRVTVEADEGGDELLYSGEHGLQVKIDKEEETLFEGSISGLNEVELGEIEAGESDELTFIFSLPEAADNNYQGLENTFTFLFEATQVNNPGWDEAGTTEPEEPQEPGIVSERTVITDWNSRIERIGGSQNYRAIVEGRLVKIVEYDNDTEDRIYLEGETLSFTYNNSFGSSRTVNTATGAGGWFNLTINNVHRYNSNVTPQTYTIE